MCMLAQTALDDHVSTWQNVTGLYGGMHLTDLVGHVPNRV